MEGAQRGCNAIIGKTASQARRRILYLTTASQCLDQQYLQQPFEHKFACRSMRKGLVADQLRQRREPRLSARKDDMWKQRHEQSHFRRTERTMPDPDAEVWRLVFPADTKTALANLDRFS